MTKEFPASSPYRFLALSALLCVFLFAGASCRRGQAPSGKNIDAPGRASAAFNPETMWNSECSTCHYKEKMKAVTPEAIHNAINKVAVMSSYAEALSDQDIKAMADYLTVSPGESSTGEDEVYEFVSSRTCGSCHDTNHAQWKASMHALAHVEPVYDAYFIKASQDSDKELEVFCAQCHTLIGVLNGEIPFKQPLENIGDTKVSEIAADGVQCDFCHSISASKDGKTGNASYIVTRANKKYGPYDDAVSPFHETAYSELHTSAEFCGNCHDVDHPGNGIPLETTYKEWKNGPYASEGTVCQDCHMTRGLTDFQANPGKAALTGPDRDHVALHYFVGPNLMFKNVDSAPEMRALSERLLRSAAAVDVAGLEQDGGALSLTVDVTNTGAGHNIPTGVTEIRQVWLDITAAGPDGNVFFHSGALDADGNLAPDPEPVLFYTWVRNEQGEFTTQFWNAVEKVRDHRIPPRETVTETLSLPAHSGPVTVSVKLQYRSVSPAGLKEVNASGTLESIPVFTMAEDDETFSF